MSKLTEATIFISYVMWKETLREILRVNMEYGIVDWESFGKLKKQGMATYLNLYA